ncbi:MAG: NUDIX domain-containing protein [Roseburia sp.]|nr:NUDIX domain-containing protein [Anaeroplasma bactoclasticum]MCM1195472.1 NUDIX domain-containing protein [Roseburia sp.]MCM1555950.1 NUDIX domain-containing protein [Anaeroplasma bactoclasticum]
MKYCMHCGTKLIDKELEHEGIIPYCPTCKEYRFKIFNTAVSIIITPKALDKVLLIEQYGRKKHILVAGYINQGENAEDAARREIFEEVGLKVNRLIFQKTDYYEKSNTLMINFIAIVEDMNVHPNYEIDDYAWFSIEEGKEKIAKGSLAEKFYMLFYNKVKNHEI